MNSRTKREVYRITRSGDMAMPFAYHGHMGPPFWGEGGPLAMVPFERVIVVSYKFSIVTIALSLTIRPQFEVSNAEINRGGSLWAQISGCSAWSRSMMFGSAESERPTLTNCEIILQEFQPM